ncbi:MAG: rod shape-determining protein MreD [Nevskiales bacterium]|nr:rod shape-determining protein MreD [Nevskiales bacterium]
MNERTPRRLIAVSLLVALILQLLELPYALAVLRPLWVPLVLVYWVMTLSQPGGLFSAWLMGLLLDVLLNCVLGQHALGLTAVVFVTLQTRNILALYPVWQQAAVLTPAWLLYAFLMFWIDGASGHSADPWLQWVPVLTTGLCWPLVVATLDGVRHRVQNDPAHL